MKVKSWKTGGGVFELHDRSGMMQLRAIPSVGRVARVPAASLFAWMRTAAPDYCDRASEPLSFLQDGSGSSWLDGESACFQSDGRYFGIGVNQLINSARLIDPRL